MPFTAVIYGGRPEPVGWAEPRTKVEGVTSIVLAGKDGVNLVITQNEQGEYQWHKTGQWRDQTPTVMA